MQMAPYLSFKGDCEAAFTLYARCLGGQVGELFRYAGSPMSGEVPADWGNKVMHGSVKLGDQVLMGADVAPGQYEAPKGFTLSLHMTDTADAERIFTELASGGRTVMPLEKTFWAERFGMAVDRFGIPWTINCGD
jgi:PhnB protein